MRARRCGHALHAAVSVSLLLLLPGAELRAWLGLGSGVRGQGSGVRGQGQSLA